jgi:hypothetical protein
MEDRELLERAAKAAGIAVRWERDPSMPFQERWQAMVPCGWVGQPGEMEWNPLRDDGDALRLAVTLDLVIFQHDDMGGAVTVYRDWQHKTPTPVATSTEPWAADKFAATRRCIVRAAASLATKE